MVIVFIFIGKKKNSAESSRVNKLKRWLKKIKGLPARVKKKKTARKEIRRLALRSVNRSTRGKSWKTS